MKDFVLIDTSNISLAKSIISKNAGKNIVVMAKDEEFNRKLMETSKNIIMFGFELQENKDKLRERSSGLNQVLCKLAKANNISIGIEIDKLFNIKDDKALSIVISRINQNIDLCKKYNVSIAIINAKSVNLHDLGAFLITLGMPTNMAKYALDNVFNL